MVLLIEKPKIKTRFQYPPVVQFLGTVRKAKTRNPKEDGGVAQLGEHLPCKQGVMGSNPIISTKR